MAQRKKKTGKTSPGFSKEFNYRLDYFAEEFIDISSESAREIGFTAMDVYENKSTIFVEIELAGVNPNEISVTVLDNRLVIKGTKFEPSTRQPGLTFHCAECSFGSFRRAFVLGSAIDAQNIVAKYNNGILKLEVPKVPERRNRPHQIKVDTDE